MTKRPPDTRHRGSILAVILASCALTLAVVSAFLPTKPEPWSPFAEPVQTAPAGSGTTAPASKTGSTLDTLTVSWRETWDPEITHTLSTARLPDEVDEAFFKRHIERVVAFRAFLRRK
jgi:hypothetical protein